MINDMRNFVIFLGDDYVVSIFKMVISFDKIFSKCVVTDSLNRVKALPTIFKQMTFSQWYGIQPYGDMVSVNIDQLTYNF